MTDSVTLISDRVALKIEGCIAFVSLSRPDKYNGLDLPMFEGLVKAAKKIRKDRSIRAVILSGEGKCFSSGLDVAGLRRNPLGIGKLLLKPGRSYTNLAQDVAWCWRELPIPVIAIIHGKCYGGGLQIPLGADFRIAKPDAELSVMEIKWGLIPDMTGSVTLRELVAIDVAKELAMTGRLVSAEEAKALGLVTSVSEDPMPDAIALAQQISSRSPDAIAAAKKLFNETWTADEKTALNLETRLQKKLIGRWNQIAAASKNLMDNPLDYRKRRFKG
ncbi:MAG: crotonase/enoyl-CoA hydratase family protein [Pseudomonadales bacterium]|nr:crotonase/enoyl-CoA hydratase family protein [Pseudomonadales bacterium]